MFKGIINALLAACIPFPVLAEISFFAEGKAEYVAHGVQCFAEAGEISTGHNTIDGEVIEHEELPTGYDLETYFVPAVIGTSFSLKLKALDDLGDEYLVAVVFHPPMGEEQRERQLWGIPPLKSGDVTALGYTLEDEIELVPGQWIFRLLDKEEILLQWAFELVDGQIAEELLLKCPSGGPKP